MAHGYVLRDSSFKVDDTEYNAEVSKVLLSPDQPTQTMRTLAPNGVIQDTDSATYTLNITLSQNWATGGLAKYLNDNAGSEVDVIFVPKNGTGNAKASFSVIAKAVDFGGEQGSFVTAELELPVTTAITWGTAA